MVGDIPGVDFGDITIKVMLIPVIGQIGPLGITVPFAGEYALATDALKSQPDATDTSKQIYEAKTGVFWRVVKRDNQLFQALSKVRLWLCLLELPASERTGVDLLRGCHVSATVGFKGVLKVVINF